MAVRTTKLAVNATASAARITHVDTRTHIGVHVAQLWQRDRSKLDTFSISVQLYSQNHKIAFFGHPVGHQRQYKRFI